MICDKKRQTEDDLFAGNNFEDLLWCPSSTRKILPLGNVIFNQIRVSLTYILIDVQ